MAAEPFNSQGGFTVAIPPIEVVDANGNVVTNVLTTGNVTANVVYASVYRYSNGQPLVSNAAGSNTQVQFNNNGSFAGNPNLTFNSTQALLTVRNLTVSGNASLGDVGNIAITGGENGYVLQTDGQGNLSWTAQTGGGGNGSPAGANSQLQYNLNGSFGANPTLTFDSSSNSLIASNIVATTVTANLIGLASTATTAGTVTQSSQPNITSVGTLLTLNVGGQITSASANLGNSVAANYFIGSGLNLSNIPGANIIGSVPLAGQVTGNAQPNVTSLGTLIDLDVNGAVEITGNLAAGNLSASHLVAADNLAIDVNASITGNLTTTGNVNFSSSKNINLGTLANIRISGGLNGYVIATDGLGNLQWVDNGGGGSGNTTPGGGNTQIQFNDVGTFNGNPAFTFNKNTNVVTVQGRMAANVLQIGTNTNKFTTTEVFKLTTSGGAPFQTVVSIEATTIKGADYVMVTTDPAGTKRQINKFSMVIYGNTFSYNETSALDVNGMIGDFTMGYDAGNITTPATITLYFTPLTSNLITTSCSVTTYD